MSKLLVLALSSLSLLGCGKQGGVDPSAKLTEFKDAMCKCKAGDAACATKVVDDQKKWGEEMAKSVDKDSKPDPDLAKKLEPIMADYTKCMTAAMTPDKPSVTVSDKPVKEGGTCPAGSTGPGTADKPCVGKGRMVEMKWTGKWDAKGAVFTVTSKFDKKIDFEQLEVFYYDKDDKLITFGEYNNQSTGESGGVIMLDPKETKDQAFGFDEKKAPKGTVKVEAEVNKIGWDNDKVEGGEAYWENESLIAEKRPLGGHPQ